MPGDQHVSRSDVLGLTGEIVAAHVTNKQVKTADLAPLIQAVFEKLDALAGQEPASVQLPPAVPIRKSVTDDYIVCLEDGMKLRVLKRHLRTHHGMAPEEYRAKWGLKPDYPMVAPSYARRRQELAKQIGLGRRPRGTPPAPKPKPRRSRTKAAAA